MNTDVAYILGLVIGGGIWGENEDIFKIRLPYRQWGSYLDNPTRAGQISRDVMRMVSPLFRTVYGINISYDTSGSEWNILCEGNLSTLKSQLDALDISCKGELRKNVDLSKLIPLLVDDNLKRRFIAGLADTIGSMTKSHRRFSDNIQIISFELSGFNYRFVIDLCQLLHSIGCYPDQILWNHPNFHCGNNAFDHRWKKGTKLRVMLDQYEKYGAFAFTSKTQALRENQKLESQRNVAHPCAEQGIGPIKLKCKHTDEDSSLLPEEIRGCHLIHNKHICAMYNCPYAPLEDIELALQSAEEYVSPFPILVKGKTDEIESLIKENDLYNRKYEELSIKISYIYSLYIDQEALIFKKSDRAGYPVSKVIEGIHYLISVEMGTLNGKRPKGELKANFKKYLEKNPEEIIHIKLPDLLTPLILEKNGYSVMVSPENPAVYKKLISFDSENKYKMYLRDITVMDLQ